MSGPFQGPAATAGSSPRVVLAELALQAALAVPEVVIGDAGPHDLRVTADPSGGVWVGVSVTAEPGGRYAVDLRLVAQLAPLVPLAETVRHRVHESARRLGLADRLGTINVEFARVVDPSELAALTALTAAAATIGGPPGAGAPSGRPPVATPLPATPPAVVPAPPVTPPVNPEVIPPLPPRRGEGGLG